MPRVKLNLGDQVTAEPSAIISLRPGDILPGPEQARPGQSPANAQERLEALAKSIMRVGQVQPLAVAADNGSYRVVAGERRRQAALLIEEWTGKAYPLCCVVDPNGSLDRAIHENLHRQDLTPLQLATLIRDIRTGNKWKGTKEVSDYLGISRAQVSQHDKLLTKPADMGQEEYDELILQVGSGMMGADTAFYTLTHVEPKKAGTVVERAKEIATHEKRNKPVKVVTPKTIEEAKKPAKVEKKHVKQAARELDAEKKDKALYKTVDDFRKLFANRKFGDFGMVVLNWSVGEGSDQDVIETFLELSDHDDI